MPTRGGDPVAIYLYTHPIGGSVATRHSPFLEDRHTKIHAQARALSLKDLEPLEDGADKDAAGPARTCVERMGKAGLLRHAVPAAFGGAAADVEVRSLVAAREGVAYGSGFADAMLALQALGSLSLTLAGSEEQKKQWLPQVAAGKAIAAFAVTEPDAGSDVASMTTTATRRGPGWVLNGTKAFISNAGLADFYTLFCKTDPAAGAKGMTCFLLDGHRKGLSVEPLRLMAPHPIGTLRLKNVAVSRDDLVGDPGHGYKVALTVLDRMRPTVAAAAVGLAQRALDAAVERARSRQQFGRPLSDNQGLRWRLADAATELEAARLLVYRAAWLKDQGQERITLESAQAKLFATEAAQRVVDLALQVHGGSGTLAGSLPERLYREVRALRIYEGTSEILRDVVGRHLVDAAAEHR